MRVYAILTSSLTLFSKRRILTLPEGGKADEDDPTSGAATCMRQPLRSDASGIKVRALPTNGTTRSAAGLDWDA